MKFVLNKLWGNELFKGSVILTVASFIGNILNYFVNIATGRALGPSGYGEIAALFSYISVTSLPMTIITIILIQKIASSGNDQLSYTYSLEKYFWKKIRQWWFFSIPIVLSVPFIPRLTNLDTITSLFFVPIILLSFIGSFYGAALQGLSMFSTSSIFGILSTLLRLAGALMALFWLKSISLILIFFLLAMIIPLIVTIYILKKRIKEDNAHYLPINKRLVSIFLDKQFIITSLSIFAVSLFGNIDIMFVKKFFSGTESGIYSSWSLFSKIIFYFVGPIMAVSLIYFSKENKKNTNQNTTLHITLLFLLLLSISNYIAYRYFAHLIINVFFGSKFLAVIPYLTYASIFGAVYAATLLMNNYFLAKKSYGVLILPISICFYILSLFFIERSLIAVIMLNTYFAIIVAVFYFGFYIKAQWKKYEHRPIKRSR